MPNRKKLLVVAIVVAVGVVAGVLFRKSPDAAVEESATEREIATIVERTPAISEKPAPASHLVGRIDPAEQSAPAQVPVGPRGSAPVNLAAPSGGISAIPTSTLATPSAAPPVAVSPSSGTYNEVRRHKVADGDTLTGLAVKYLGSADRYREIYDLNREMLTNPDLLPIGSELKIPVVGSTIATSNNVDSRPMVPVAPRGSIAPQP